MVDGKELGLELFPIEIKAPENILLRGFVFT